MKTAMILAAGRGERLKPLTEHIPKAMCLVHNRPLIEYHVQALVAAGFHKIVINHAYLGGHIRRFLGDGSRYGIEIVYSPEPPGGLETGGGIVRALPLLGDTPFLVINADIYTDCDLAAIALETVTSMHLVLLENNPELGHFGDFGLREGNRLSNTPRTYTFAGIGAYHPHVFKECLQGRFSITPLLRRYADLGLATASLHHGLWCDIGSLERLTWANRSQAHNPHQC